MPTSTFVDINDPALDEIVELHDWDAEIAAYPVAKHTLSAGTAYRKKSLRLAICGAYQWVAKCEKDGIRDHFSANCGMRYACPDCTPYLASKTWERHAPKIEPLVKLPGYAHFIDLHVCLGERLTVENAASLKPRVNGTLGIVDNLLYQLDRLAENTSMGKLYQSNLVIRGVGRFENHSYLKISVFLAFDEDASEEWSTEGALEDMLRSSGHTFHRLNIRKIHLAYLLEDYRKHITIASSHSQKPEDLAAAEIMLTKVNSVRWGPHDDPEEEYSVIDSEKANTENSAEIGPESDGSESDSEVSPPVVPVSKSCCDICGRKLTLTLERKSKLRPISPPSARSS